MTRVLVTGAAGFIGFHLCRFLLEEGKVEVVSLDNMNEYYDLKLKNDRLAILREMPNFRFIKADISDAEAMCQIFSETEFDVVINLAAQAGVRYSIDCPETYIESNIVGFFNILQECRKHHIRHLIFASSSSVYGDQEKTPFSESDRTDSPVSLYAATKKCDEELAYSYSAMFGMPITGLRFFTVYGPYGRPDMAYYKFADRIRNGKAIELYNNGDMLRDFTYVSDVVNVIGRLIEKPPAADPVPFKIYNIGKGSPDRLLDFVEALERLYGKSAEKRFLPMQTGDVHRTYADTSEIEKDLDYKPSVTLEEGLGKFIEWYKGYHGVI